jgi:hypothetical protein
MIIARIRIKAISSSRSSVRTWFSVSICVKFRFRPKAGLSQGLGLVQELGFSLGTWLWLVYTVSVRL